MNSKIKTVYDGMDKLITAIESGKANNEKVLIALCKSVKALCAEMPYDTKEMANDIVNNLNNPSGIEEMLKGFAK